MKKTRRRQGEAGRDSMRPGYGFTGLARGKQASKYKQGASVIVIDADLVDAFPDTEAVNDALRLLLTVARTSQRGSKARSPA